MLKHNIHVSFMERVNILHSICHIVEVEVGQPCEYDDACEGEAECGIEGTCVLGIVY